MDVLAPPPDLAPEERFESHKQVWRQSGGGDKPHVRHVWGDDRKTAHGLLVEVSPPPEVFDPVGIVAEMSTEHTVSRIEMNSAHMVNDASETKPEPVEMGDNSILAPIEALESRQALLRHQQNPHWPFSETEQPPAYQPYVPDQHSTYLQPDRRRAPGAFGQRDVSLNMSLKLPGKLEPNTVPRVLSLPQMRQEEPKQQGPLQDQSSSKPAGSDRHAKSLQQPAKSAALAGPQSSFQPGHARSQSHGALSKFP